MKTLPLGIRRAGWFLLGAGACWPLGPWLVDRWFRWDKMWIQVSLFAAVFLVWALRLRTTARTNENGENFHRSRLFAPSFAPGCLAIAAAFFAVNAVLYRQMPVLLGYVLLASGLACLLLGLLPASRRRQSWGLCLLLLLALPVMPTVQYLVGYPLRVAVARVSSLWLGSDVQAVGTGLVSGGETFFVDAPCSGLGMLFTALVLTGAVALALRLPPARTLVLAVVGLCSAVAGNVTRAVGLYILETRFGENGFLHEAIGIANFLVCALMIVWAGKALQKGAQGPVEVRRVERFLPWRAKLSAGLFVASCIGAFAMPFFGRVNEAAACGDQKAAFDWPVTWNGRLLSEVPFDGRVAEFLGIFPGRMAEFEVAGTNQRIFLRWTPMATRKLHPSEGCFRATGGTITPLPGVRDGSGHLWSRFRVGLTDGTDLLVRQCYFALGWGTSLPELAELIADAESWPDASAWYWAAALPGSSVESTLAVTIAIPETR